MDQQQWADDFNRRVAEIQAKSVALQEKLDHSTATAQTGDGLVSVTVGPNGALLDLRIDDRALRRGRTGEQLSASIMEAFGRAQRKAANEVADALEPLAGGTEMMRVVRGFLPQPEEPEDTEEPPEFAAPEQTSPPPPPPPPPPRASPPPPPRTARRDDGVDEDETQPW